MGGYKPRTLFTSAAADESEASFAPQLDRGVMLGQIIRDARAGAGGAQKAPKTPAGGRKNGEPSASATPKTEPAYQVLYIQMEYCEGKTLREVIDKVSVGSNCCECCCLVDGPMLCGIFA